ncbi:MAG: BolA/IbaG family iron-sulfur metabolism protein [Aphanocapsa lilacina HA4352-LM1]|jgi:BolA protein|nr:BolA/IbaG family iron-sulfur metabolism protein [Aphanocapsa lilacina HA4352-LM1]
MNTAQKIAALLKSRLHASVVEIEDHSDRHAGHAGAAGGGGHYNVLIVSERFAGVPAIRRHRLVYEALATEMESAIHALSLRALAPDEWQASADRPQ